MAKQDPWEIAAQAISAERTERELAATAQKQMDDAAREARQAVETAAYRALEAAQSAAVSALTKFLADRGQAAQKLLAAYGDRAYILFGADSEGGSYASVYLGPQGLKHEVGTSGMYSTNKSPKIRDATIREAVSMFSSFGQGGRDPQKVRNIVDWLTKQIDGYAKPR